jgi:hypothetical protein
VRSPGEQLGAKGRRRDAEGTPFTNDFNEAAADLLRTMKEQGAGGVDQDSLDKWLHAG